MKKIYFAWMAVAALVLTSCDKPSVNGLAGPWVLTEYEYEVEGSDQKVPDSDLTAAQIVSKSNERKKESTIGYSGVRLNEDGTFITSDGFSGNWKVDGKDVLLITPGVPGETFAPTQPDTATYTYRKGELTRVQDMLEGDHNKQLKEYGLTKYIITTVLTPGEWQVPTGSLTE